MSIDQNANATVAEPMDSAIENEIPTYRAISRGAVFALVFGVLAILSYASLDFLAFSALAILCGWQADRKIQRYSDTLTGRGLAQSGFGLGLIFGLTAISIVLVQGFLRSTDAKRFGLTFEKVVQSGTLNEAIWYTQPPSSRVNTTPDEAVKSMKASASNAMMFEQSIANIKLLKQAVDNDQSTVHYDGIERHGEDGLNMFAAIRYELHAAKPPKPEDTERFALAHCLAIQNERGKYEWMVKDIQFPYKPGTFKPVEAPVDDGHGHGGGGHSH